MDLKVKELLTEHLKKDTKYRRVTIGVGLYPEASHIELFSVHVSFSKAVYSQP